MRTGKQKRTRARAPRDEHGDGWSDALLVSVESEKRVEEMARVWGRLKQWGVSAKLPHRKGSIGEVDTFFANWLNGTKDVTAIVGTSAVIRGMEAEARDYDIAKKVAGPFEPMGVKSPFDIENATIGLQGAAVVGEVAKDVGEVAKDVVKAGAENIASGAKIVPVWVWGLVGVVGGVFVLRELRMLSQAGATVLGERGGARERNGAAGGFDALRQQLENGR